MSATIACDVMASKTHAYTPVSMIWSWWRLFGPLHNRPRVAQAHCCTAYELGQACIVDIMKATPPHWTMQRRSSSALSLSSAITFNAAAAAVTSTGATIRPAMIDSTGGPGEDMAALSSRRQTADSGVFGQFLSSVHDPCQ